MTMTYFQSEVNWTGLQTVGAQTVSRRWTYGRKLVSYLSSGLHFDPDQPALLAAGPSRHSSFWLLQISACFLSQPFLLTLLYLTDIFRWSCQRGLHFSTPNFNVLDRTRPVPNKKPFSLLLSLMLLVVTQSNKVPLFSVSSERCFIFVKKGRHVVRHLAEQYTQGTS